MKRFDWNLRCSFLSGRGPAILIRHHRRERALLFPSQSPLSFRRHLHNGLAPTIGRYLSPCGLLPIIYKHKGPRIYSIKFYMHQNVD